MITGLNSTNASADIIVKNIPENINKPYNLNSIYLYMGLNATTANRSKIYFSLHSSDLDGTDISELYLWADHYDGNGYNGPYNINLEDNTSNKYIFSYTTDRFSSFIIGDLYPQCADKANIVLSCICGSTVKSSGYCCSGTWQSDSCDSGGSSGSGSSGSVSILPVTEEINESINESIKTEDNHNLTDDLDTDTINISDEDNTNESTLKKDNISSDENQDVNIDKNNNTTTGSDKNNIEQQINTANPKYLLYTITTLIIIISIIILSKHRTVKKHIKKMKKEKTSKETKTKKIKSKHIKKENITKKQKHINKGDKHGRKEKTEKRRRHPNRTYTGKL